MEIKLALKVNDKDNVATIFANGITDGTEVEIRDKKGNAETVTVIGDVPYGHKIAVRDIKKGELNQQIWRRDRHCHQGHQKRRVRACSQPGQHAAAAVLAERKASRG